ncbi:MAG: PQQ-binding-like beta-propeller repeat protein [Acidobacteriota bacterium]
MRSNKIILSLGSVAALAMTAWMAVAQQPRQITEDVLRDAGKTGEEWVTYGINWSEQRYSQLFQINNTNVSRLGMAWTMDIPAASGNGTTRHEGTALISNGVLYSIGPWSVVYAVDARTGKEIWHQNPDVNQAVWQSRICCGVVNRGIALYEGNVIAPVVDGRLRAYDAQTGRVVWDTRVSPENMPYTITMAPRVIKGGKVIIGVSGGEYGVRGFFDAYDAKTGVRAWRYYTVPGDPSKPFEQPEFADWAKTWDASKKWWELGGGAPVWNGFAYDPDTDTVYVGTGQPATWTDMSRGKGDALCTDCIIAVRGATGKYIWHYQTTPGDNWDYDSIADIMLADLPINGKKRAVLMHAPKNGFFYVLDRKTGELLSAEPWVTVSWATGVDLKTGRPRVNPEANYGAESISVMPGPGGGHVWVPWSFNPNTGLVYIPSTIGGGYTYQANPEYTPLPTDIGPTGRGNMNMGTGQAKGKAKGGPPVGLAPGLDATAVAAAGGAPGPGATKGGAPPAVVVAGNAPAAGAGGPGAAKGGGGAPGRGAAKGPPVPQPPSVGPTGRGNILSAWDPVTQTERWRAENAAAGYNQGGTLSTAGNLVFSSAPTAGQSHLLAFKADTGEKVLDLPTGLSQLGPPMTFMLDGKQYIVIAGGPIQAGGGGFGGGGGGGAGAAKGGAPVPPPISRMVALVLDGTKPLPGVPPPPPAQ